MTANKEHEPYLKFLRGDFEDFYKLDDETKEQWLTDYKGEFVNIQAKLLAETTKNAGLVTELSETKEKLETTESDLKEKSEILESAKEDLEKFATLKADVAEKHRLVVINEIKEQYEGKGLILTDEKSKELDEAEANVLETELLFLEKLEINPDLLKSEPNDGIEEGENTNPSDGKTENNNEFSKEALQERLNLSKTNSRG